MKFFLWVLLALSLMLFGCGGESGDSSSSSENPSTNQSGSPEQTKSITIHPLLDLGLSKGDNVCFRIKTYNNVTESDFSGSICSILKNEEVLNLTWNDVPGDVVGYYVYYGTEKNNASKFLKNVLES